MSRSWKADFPTTTWPVKHQPNARRGKTSGNKDSLQVLEVLNGCRRVCASAFQERTECNLDSLKLGNQTGSGVVAKLF